MEQSVYFKDLVTMDVSNQLRSPRSIPSFEPLNALPVGRPGCLLFPLTVQSRPVK